MPADRSALGSFLRSRRDRLTPSEAGITAFPGPRRVPGLRKEELTVLAGLSADHYSRLEQGRQHTVTDEVVEALSRALGLDEVVRAHLRDLAAPPLRRPPVWETPQRADPGLLRVLTTLDHVPALILGRRSQVLACDALLRAALGVEVDTGSVFVRWVFLDQRARGRIENWPRYAAAAVGALRYEVGRHPVDRGLRALVDELRAADSDFAQWWDDHGVTDRTSVDKRIVHPTLGRLTFGIEAVVSPTMPTSGWTYTVEPGSPTAQCLPLLASWGLEDPADQTTQRSGR